MRLILACALVVGSVAQGALAQQPRLALDNAALAGRIVRQLALKPGEHVIIVAHPGMLEPLVPHLRYEVMKAGGVDLGVVLVPPLPMRGTWDRGLFDKATRDARAAYKTMFREVDAAIMMPGATPADAAYAAMQDWLHEARGRTVHFHWLENNSAYPLAGQPLPPEATIDAVYQRAVLDTDYEALGALERRFADAMRGRDIHITSPAGTDLRFRIGDRPVNLQDGDASAARAARGKVLVDREIEIPAGVVRVAPVEDSIEGTIAFPPSQWDGRPVDGLKLTFSRGEVSGIAASAGRDAVEAEMARAGGAGRSFREFALGLNPLLAIPERGPWIPYYGYGAGVVRLSLGDNSELGGAVGGGYVRWNFFTDLTVTIGETTWVRDGKLMIK
jgi:leucyl aminopeptidase (aminopeptidase T)